jgi:broad specificity phosphatase PhoE
MAAGMNRVHSSIRVSITVFFETHATSFDNVGGLASGWYDVDLSPLGEAQARELGERCIDRELEIVYCSDLRRSYRTAEIAFARRSIPILRDARLRECNYGTLTRRPATEIDAVRKSMIGTPFPGGESYEQVTARVSEFLHEIARGYSGPVLVIGHRATYFALEHLLKRRSLEETITAVWRWQPGWTYELARAGSSA